MATLACQTGIIRPPAFFCPRSIQNGRSTRSCISSHRGVGLTCKSTPGRPNCCATVSLKFWQTFLMVPSIGIRCRQHLMHEKDVRDKKSSLQSKQNTTLPPMVVKILPSLVPVLLMLQPRSASLENSGGDKAALMMGKFGLIYKMRSEMIKPFVQGHYMNLIRWIIDIFAFVLLVVDPMKMKDKDVDGIRSTAKEVLLTRVIIPSLQKLIIEMGQHVLKGNLIKAVISGIWLSMLLLFVGLLEEAC